MRERLKADAAIQPNYDATALAHRGELVKHVLRNVADEHVDAKDIVHVLVIGMQENGTPQLFHSYGDLELTEVRDFLRMLHAQCAAQCAHDEQNQETTNAQ